MKKIKRIKGQSIYNPSGKAGEYSYWACNFYVGCSNGCTYCYCKKGLLAGTMGMNKPQLKKCFKDEEQAMDDFQIEMMDNIDELRKHGLFFSFTTDPMADECLQLTWRAAMMAMGNGIPVKILTKLANRWVDDIIEQMHDSWKKVLAIGFTLTGHDELEPEASTNSERIRAIKQLHNAGFKTFASIEPVIDTWTSLNMIGQTLDFCDLHKVGIESGKKYTKIDLNDFVHSVTRMKSTNGKSATIYFKDSLLKAAGINRADLPANCVSRDYNMFNTPQHV